MSNLSAFHSLDSFGCRSTLPGFPDLIYYSLPKLAKSWPAIRTWPRVKLIFLENLLRSEDGQQVTRALIESYLSTSTDKDNDTSIPFFPARVLMQDYAGISALVDIAGLRDIVLEHGAAADSIAPRIPVDLVVDHSLQVAAYGHANAAAENLRDEYRLNKSRYEFLRWAEQSIPNLRVVPPGRGIVHQVNIEVLSTGTRVKNNEIFFDTLVGTDSHTPMVNGLGILGWGVGGIEALAAMLGQAIWLSAPRVTGIRLIGQVSDGVYAADIALNLAALLRRIGVVGHFLEFFGPGSSSLSVFDKATIANMTPEYGATCSLFPATASTLAYFEKGIRTDISGESAAALQAYLQAQDMLSATNQTLQFDRVIEFDLSLLQASFAGPSRPDQLHSLSELKSTFLASAGIPPAEKPNTATSSIGNGAIAIAAITSCTNTANPKSMLAAGLVAQKAIALGLRIPAHVKCSFTPGSIAVDRYLAQTSLLAPLEQLGFNLAGYGCATCVGNSGDLAPEMQKAVNRSDNQLTLASVLSGNRNFESRIHPKIGANFLVSPALVVALAIAGTVLLDPTTDPIGIGHTGSPVYLKDLMPDPSHLDKLFSALNTTTEITASRTETFAPSPQWAALGGTKNATFPWRADDSYFKRPDVLNALLAFESSTVLIQPMKPLLVLGDNITTDHISPVGRISAASEAAHLLKQYGETSASFNSYGARRGNAGVMIRGTFDNPRLHNLLAGTMGPFTKTQSDAAPVSIFQASGDIARSGYAAVVIGGKNYGTGSARDWAAKGQRLLGVRAVIAESFERIHRSNLVMFGVAPVLLDAESLAQLRQLLIPESIVTVQLQKDHASYIRPSATIEVINADSHHAFKADLQLETAYEYTLLAAGGLLASMHLI